MNNRASSYNSFIFTHIPKCAGTSFRKYIYNISVLNGIEKKKIYIPGTFDIPNNKNISQLSKEECNALAKRSVKVLADHSKYKEHLQHKITIEKPFYYTILREPVNRFISHYNFFYFKDGNKKFKNKSLNEIKEDDLKEVLNQLANLQMNYLANIKFFRSFGLENVLKVAKYNLQHEYACFGILEKMEASVDLLKENLPKWLSSKETSFPIVNSNKQGTTDIDPKIIELIKEYNQYDIELYKFALLIFEDVLHQKSKELPASITPPKLN